MRKSHLPPKGQRTQVVAGFAVVSQLMLAGASVAGVNTWTQIGPEGGEIHAVAGAPSEPAVLYAAGATIFRSSDEGVTWERTAAPKMERSCQLSVDAIDPQRLYCVGEEGVLLSVNAADTWTESSSGLPALISPSSIKVDRNDSSFLVFTDEGRIFTSRDRAESWQETPGPAGVAVASVLVDPAVAGSLWMLTSQTGIYRSADFGASWAPLPSDLPTGLRPYWLQWDPQDSSLLYLESGSGTLRSSDGGSHWIEIPARGSLVVGADSVLYGFETSSIYFVPQVFRSEDFGTTWELLSSSPFPFIPILGGFWMTSIPHGLLAGGSLSLRRSVDRGESWQDAISGMQASTVNSLAVDRQGPSSLYGVRSEATRSERLEHSPDRGSSWESLLVAPEEGRPYITDFAIDPFDSRHLLASTTAAYPSPLGGILSSRDEGGTWTLLPGTFGCIQILEVAADPLAENRLFLAGSYAQFCTASCFTWRTDNAGEAWQCISPDEPGVVLHELAPSPFVPGLVLALGPRGLYRSVNSGTDWSRVTEQAGTLPEYFANVVWASADTAYAASADAGSSATVRLLVSHDRGMSWQPVASPTGGDPEPPWLTELAIDPFHPERIYGLAQEPYGADPREVVRSSDGGRTWTSLSVGLQGWSLSDLTMDPVTPNRLYVSAAGGGILAYDIQIPEPCVPSATALCITDGRFKIESLWRDFAGNSGVGHAVPLASDTGSFWFFGPDNLELFVKEIDGVSYNNAFWTFYGALSNVEFTLLATDTATGAQHGYFNRSTQFASQGDIESFPQGESVTASASVAAPAVLPLRRRPAPQRSANSCVPNATTLCLADGRFAASVTWRDFAGRRGVGTPIVLTPDTGSFWFFDAGIHELAVKVIDGRGTNDAFWVFYGSLSNVEFELTVVDTETGDSWTRENPSGTFASGGDIEAFPQ
jgi:photosystem II stability/assembly factor-like uncharacterized protein